MKQAMPPNGFSRSIQILLSAALVLIFVTSLHAQSSPDPAQPAGNAAQSSPDPALASDNSAQPTSDQAKPSPIQSQSAEALQSRITRARGLIAAHQLDIAASELESVRGGTQDYILRNVTSVMLMKIYLEEGNYIRAEALLEEAFQAHSKKNDDSIRTYFALAGQAVNGARTHLARYRSLGINTTDTGLPAEALKDLNRLRSLLERMVLQAREISNNRRAYDSWSLLEDVLGLRLSLAKDAEDQTKWQVEYARTREVLASSQTEVASLGGGPVIQRTQQSNGRAARAPVATTNPGTPPANPEQTVAQPSTDSVTPPPLEAESKGSAVDSTEVQNASEPDPINTGFLNSRATRIVPARYPEIAKKKGEAGLVRVYVVVDETGKVIEVSRSEGPVLLRPAAEEAARQWSFEPSSNGARPARLVGYIDFNFTL